MFKLATKYSELTVSLCIFYISMFEQHENVRVLPICISNIVADVFLLGVKSHLRIVCFLTGRCENDYG
jgi:hypothetical protein